MRGLPGVVLEPSRFRRIIKTGLVKENGGKECYQGERGKLTG